MIDAIKVTRKDIDGNTDYWVIYLDTDRQHPAAFLHGESMQRFMLTVLQEDTEMKEYVKAYIDRI